MLLLHFREWFLTEMSSSHGSESDNSIDFEELLEFGKRCREVLFLQLSKCLWSCGITKRKYVCYLIVFNFNISLGHENRLDLYWNVKMYMHIEHRMYVICCESKGSKEVFLWFVRGGFELSIIASEEVVALPLGCLRGVDVVKDNLLFFISRKVWFVNAF